MKTLFTIPQQFKLSSPVPSDQVEQLTDTQSSNATTITLSSPKQTVGQWEEGQDISTTTCNTKAERVPDNRRCCLANAIFYRTTGLF